MAIRFVVLLLESAFVQLTLAERADKVLWVILAIHCRDAATGDRLVTSGAQ